MKIVKDQWFIDYGDEAWKEKARGVPCGNARTAREIEEGIRVHHRLAEAEGLHALVRAWAPVSRSTRRR